MGSASVDVPHVASNEQLRSRNTFTVDAERIRDYARAIGNGDPIHLDESVAAARGFGALVAPPTFATMVWMRAEEETLAAMVPGFHTGRILHADRALDIVRPLLDGDRVSCDVHFESFRHYRDYDIVSMVTTLRDHEGQIVVVGSSTLLVRAQRICAQHPGVSGYDRGLELVPARHRARVPGFGERLPVRPRGGHTGTPRPTVDFTTLRVGYELPVRQHALAPSDVMQHASVVGAPGGLAVEDRLPATPPGGPTPGMLTLGLAAGYLSSWLGDPTAVTKYRVQYAPKLHYLPIGTGDPTSIEFRGRVTWLNPVRRGATVVIDATAKGRKLFGYATAEIRFA
ncbi:FAS1-like dehydratase domain-containing protein [Nocardia blacklockiae]|uniref:FAS1-like dehydratase domain-containing protein n=1 Tax=Nocardia blacklockiae TaxID=480036 RepID=UPI00189435A6|nr:MaoC family dehydratase N-terminal domain-containing protein [Nocardia blacklockiae]MBF6174722.1 MaoC family dehydratase N-terminal domain-containing protein [Nocardia blacklockiae]